METSEGVQASERIDIAELRRGAERNIGDDYYSPCDPQTFLGLLDYIAALEAKVGSRDEAVDSLGHAGEASIELQIASQAKLDSAAERLVFALYIYPNYRVDSRGPAGCIMRALEAIAPEVAAELREHDADDVYDRHWTQDGAPR